MTPEAEECSLIAIEKARGLHRSLGAKLAAVGVSPADIAISAIYSAVDLAQQHVGDAASAIRWARHALDVMEADMPLTAETVQ